MKPKKIGVITALVLCVSLGIYNALYTVSEVQQVIITQFGKPIGEPVVDAGLKIKMPFIHEINTIDKRVLEWDGNPALLRNSIREPNCLQLSNSYTMH
ncbi:SPFH domain-containing protein [Vibrio parahaemolyticus]